MTRENRTQGLTTNDLTRDTDPKAVPQSSAS